jgi:hypothetical protein
MTAHAVRREGRASGNAALVFHMLLTEYVISRTSFRK